VLRAARAAPPRTTYGAADLARDPVHAAATAAAPGHAAAAQTWVGGDGETHLVVPWCLSPRPTDLALGVLAERFVRRLVVSLLPRRRRRRCFRRSAVDAAPATVAVDAVAHALRRLAAGPAAVDAHANGGLRVRTAPLGKTRVVVAFNADRRPAAVEVAFTQCRGCALSRGNAGRIRDVLAPRTEQILVVMTPAGPEVAFNYRMRLDFVFGRPAQSPPLGPRDALHRPAPSS